MSVVRVTGVSVGWPLKYIEMWEATVLKYGQAKDLSISVFSTFTLLDGKSCVPDPSRGYHGSQIL